MKTLLTYSSKTNNTAKVADAIYEKMSEATYKKITDLKEDEADDYEVIVIGGWIDKGHMNQEVDDFIAKLHNKKVAFFFTLGAYPTSEHAYDCIANIKDKLTANNNQVITHFHCQGAIDPALIEWMKKLPKGHGHAPDEERENRWSDASNHPSAEDFRAAHSFVGSIRRKLKVSADV